MRGAGLGFLKAKRKQHFACFGVVWFVDDFAHAGVVWHVEDQKGSRRFLVSF